MIRYILVITICCLAAVCISVHNEGRAEEMCRQFSDLYMRQCSSQDAPTRSRNLASRGFPGKRGGMGPIGPPGPSGPPGLRGIVDNERFERKIAEAKLGLEARFDEKLSQLEKKIEATNLRMLKLKSRCELYYDGKCFLAIIHYGSNVNFAAAEALCNNIGWKPANVFSIEHYNRVAIYLRTKSTSSDYISAWLGMTYDANGRRILLSNGTQLTEELPWYPGYPNSGQTWNRMNIGIRRDPSSKNQGMVNLYDTYNRHGVVCELLADTDLRD